MKNWILLLFLTIMNKYMRDSIHISTAAATLPSRKPDWRKSQHIKA